MTCSYPEGMDNPLVLGHTEVESIILFFFRKYTRPEEHIDKGWSRDFYTVDTTRFDDGLKQALFDGYKFSRSIYIYIHTPSFQENRGFSIQMPVDFLQYKNKRKRRKMFS